PKKQDRNQHEAPCTKRQEKQIISYGVRLPSQDLEPLFLLPKTSQPKLNSSRPVEALPPAQWRKCLRPVTTMAMPWSSAASVTPSSRTEPPGCTTAVAPAAAAASRPSGNG